MVYNKEKGKEKERRIKEGNVKNVIRVIKNLTDMKFKQL